MLQPLCIVRSVWRALTAGSGPQLSGHVFVEQPPEFGQPSCVLKLKCRVCGRVDVAWERCHRCGHHDPSLSEVPLRGGTPLAKVMAELEADPVMADHLRRHRRVVVPDRHVAPHWL